MREKSKSRKSEDGWRGESDFSVCLLFAWLRVWANVIILAQRQQSINFCHVWCAHEFIPSWITKHIFLILDWTHSWLHLVFVIWPLVLWLCALKVSSRRKYDFHLFSDDKARIDATWKLWKYQNSRLDICEVVMSQMCGRRPQPSSRLRLGTADQSEQIGLFRTGGL